MDVNLTTQERFVAAEGLELMLLMMKSKKQCRSAAVKCVDYALTRCPAACERLAGAYTRPLFGST